MSYAPVRAMTEQELAYMRQNGQFTKLRAVIIPQSAVLACKCAETKTNNDAVTSVAIDTITSGSGVYIRNGMTAYVGSTAGDSDLGMVRVKSFAENTLYFARVSGITWTPDVFITVVDDFGLWAKLPTLDLTSVRMDDDIVYTDQNKYMPPVPVFGADTAVPLTSGSMSYDATNSYSLNDSATTMSSYVWAVYKDGLPSGTITETGTGTAVFTFTTAGSYEIQLTLTDSHSNVAVGHRTCYVYDESASDENVLDQIQVATITGDRESGGWSAELTAYEGAGSAVRDRAKVILIADDYYPEKLSFGQLPGNERVVIVGWISGETIKYNSEESTVKFTVTGVGDWLKKTVGPSTFLEAFPEVSQDPDVWTCIPNLTIDKIAHHFLYWRSTAIEITDFYKSGNTRIVGGMSAGISSIYEQIYDTAQTRMLHYFCSDKYNRLFLWEDPQVLASGSRANIPVVATFTQDDLTEDVDLKRVVTPPVSLLEVAGLAVPAYAVSGSTTVVMYMSRAPGTLIYNRYGGNEQNDRLVVTSQTDANMLSGMLLAKRNNEYPSANFDLAQNNRMIDIAPAMFIRHEVLASDNARNVSISSGTNFLPTRVEYDVNEKGVVQVSVEAEKETIGIPGYTVTIPQEPIINIPEPPAPPIVPYPWIPDPYIPPIVPYPWIPDPPISGTYCREGTDPFGPYDVSLNGQLYSTNKFGLMQMYPAWVRPKETTNTSSYEIHANNFVFSGSVTSDGYINTPASYPPEVMDYTQVNLGSAVGWWEVVLLDGFGNVVATGVPDAYTVPGVFTGTFDNAAGTDFTYVAIKSKLYEGLPPSYSMSYYSGSGVDITVGIHTRNVPTNPPGSCGSYFNYLMDSEPEIEWTRLGGVHLWGFVKVSNVGEGYYDEYGLQSGPYFNLHWSKNTSPDYEGPPNPLPSYYHIYGWIEREDGNDDYCRLYQEHIVNPALISNDYSDGNNFDCVIREQVVNGISYNGINFGAAKYFSRYPSTGLTRPVLYDVTIEPVASRVLSVGSVKLYNICASTTSGLP